MNSAHVGDKVSIHVTGKLEDGEVFASTENKDPIRCTLGASRLIPAIEDAVIGMRPGESKTRTVQESEAFGPYDYNLLLKVSRDNNPDRIQPRVGMEIEVRRGDGPSKRMRVKKMTDNYLLLDANHALAGKALVFDIHLTNIENTARGES